jgi:hypothetical protein
MFEQQRNKKAPVRSLLWIVFTCLAVFLLMACGNTSSGSSSTSTAASTSRAASNSVMPLASTSVHPSAAFQVTSIDMAVQPQSIAGRACGTPITVTYTATFHIAANSPGGTIQFFYTVNNGRSSAPASVVVNPGQTTATYSFTWSGNLPADHTFPEPGGVMVTSPNAITSSLVGPTGTCS